MDEIYMLVKARIQRVHDLYGTLQQKEQFSEEANQNSMSQKLMEDIRKAKEEEKFRTEKENWILNVLKQLKDYTLEQKLILYERSADIMKLVYHEFKDRKVELQNLKDQFLDEFIKLYQEFFAPFEKTYEFKTSLRYVVRSNNPSIVPDMLKYLVEFSRDFFKKFMIYQSQIRTKQIILNNVSNVQGQQSQKQNSKNQNETEIQNQQQQQQFHSRSKSTLIKQDSINQHQADSNIINQEQDLKLNQNVQQNNENKEQLNIKVNGISLADNQKVQSNGKRITSPINNLQKRQQNNKQSFYNFKPSHLIKLVEIKNQQQENHCNFELKWHQKFSNENFYLAMKNNLNDAISDIDSINTQITEFKIKKLRANIEEFKNLKNNMFEILKNRNQPVVITSNQYYEKFINKFGSNIEFLVIDENEQLIAIEAESNINIKTEANQSNGISSNQNQFTNLKNQSTQNQSFQMIQQINEQKIKEQKNFIIHPPKSSNSIHRRDISNPRLQPQSQQPNQQVLMCYQQIEINQQIRQQQEQLTNMNSQIKENNQMTTQRQNSKKDQKQNINQDKQNNKQKFNDNNLLTKTKIIKLTHSRCNSAFLRPIESIQQENKDIILTQTNEEIFEQQNNINNITSIEKEITLQENIILEQVSNQLPNINHVASNHNYMMHVMTDKFKTLLLQKLNNLKQNGYQSNNSLELHISEQINGQKNIFQQLQQHQQQTHQMLLQQQNQNNSNSAIRQNNSNNTQHGNNNNNSYNSTKTNTSYSQKIEKNNNQNIQSNNTNNNTSISTNTSNSVGQSQKDSFQHIYNKLKKKTQITNIQNLPQNQNVNKYIQLRRSNQQQQSQIQSNTLQNINQLQNINNNNMQQIVRNISTSEIINQKAEEIEQVLQNQCFSQSSKKNENISNELDQNQQIQQQQLSSNKNISFSPGQAQQQDIQSHKNNKINNQDNSLNIDKYLKNQQNNNYKYPINQILVQQNNNSKY